MKTNVLGYFLSSLISAGEENRMGPESRGNSVVIVKDVILGVNGCGGCVNSVWISWNRGLAVNIVRAALFLILLVSAQSLESVSQYEDHTDPEDMFRCGEELAPGKWYIPMAWMCDGDKDCPDGADESSSCPPVTCDQDKFPCRNGSMCVSMGWLCDKERDCPDGSDEDPEHCIYAGPEVDTGEEAVFTCPPNRYLCGGTRLCLPYNLLCNGLQDCPDGEDEGMHCRSDICDAKRCPPNVKSCKPTRSDAVCVCGSNAYHNTTTNTCDDLDECQYDGYCDQICDNTKIPYKCDCKAGYNLLADGKTCLAQNVPPNVAAKLVFAQDGMLSIGQIAPNLTNVQNYNVTNQRGLDFDFDRQQLCYVADGEGKAEFQCSNLTDLSSHWQIPLPYSLTSITHLAYDWLSENWYFLDKTREKIFVCCKTGAHCITILHVNIQVPKAMALDPVKGYIFFSNRLNMPKIERARMDGSQRKTLVSTQRIVVPEALTLDYANEHIYWVDAYLDRVERLNYDGSNRKVILKKSWVENFASLVLFENFLYATKHTNNSIVKISRTDAYSNKETLLGNVQVPSAITVIHRQRQPKPDTEITRKECEHVSIVQYDTDTHTYTTRCLCEAGYKADPANDAKCISAIEPKFLIYTNARLGEIRGISINGANQSDVMPPISNLESPVALDYHRATQYIYYSDTKNNFIGRRKVDGSNRNDTFMTKGIYKCEGIAIDWIAHNIFWTDEQAKTINVARLDNTDIRKVLISKALSHPRAIVVDPRHDKGYIYWTDWVKSPSVAKAKVERSFMNGSSREVLVDEQLQWPNGLSIDLATNTLYWCDAYFDRIQSLDLNEENGKWKAELVATYSDSVGHPYGMVHDSTLNDIVFYWTEFKDGLIRRFNKQTNETIILRSESIPLYEIRMFDNTSQTDNNMCSQNNGDCEQLCLLVSNGRSCACADRYTLVNGTSCLFNNSALPPSACGPHEFACQNGHCINRGWLCDGDDDCGDNSDEDSSEHRFDDKAGPCTNFTCPNPDLMYKCADNRCIYTRWMCDGERDCKNGEDEEKEKCESENCLLNMTRCLETLRCIPNAWLCDYDNDCGDGYDELNCNYTECRPDQYTCENKRCISKEYMCDGDNDCRDNSDEKNCIEDRCDPSQFQCRKSGKCISKSLVCDGKKSCIDGSDEHNCTSASGSGSCSVNEYTCFGEERCIPRKFLCDGQKDCIKGDDEQNCLLECEPPSKLCNVTDMHYCMEVDKLCNNHIDCPDGSDEGPLCGESRCELFGFQCTRGCVNSPDEPGYVCTCPPKQFLNVTTGLCMDRHPCQQWGICSQKCVEIGPLHKCDCLPGYFLMNDGFTCKPTDAVEEYILYSKRYEILRLHIGNHTSTSLVSGLINTIALDYCYNHSNPDGEESLVFWTDVADDKIYRGKLMQRTLTNINVVIDYSKATATAEGIAVDWITEHIYWVDSSVDHIEVADFDGNERRTIISKGISKPRAIAVDPNVGKMFWTDWESNEARIEMSAMSGEPNKRRVIQNVSNIPNGRWPNGLTLDYQAQRVYWVDASTDAIHTVTYDGTDSRELLRGNGFLVHPFAITQSGDYVYWTDWGTNSLVGAKKWYGTDLKVIQKVIRNPFDLRIFHPKRQVIGPEGNPCAKEKKMCDPSAICLLSFEGLNRTTSCRCPYLKEMKNDKCVDVDSFLLLGREGIIKGTDMETGTNDVIAPWTGSYVLQPLSLDFDINSKKLYWAGPFNNKNKEFLVKQPQYGIMAASIKQSDLEVIIDTGLRVASGLAIDWISGNLFYSVYSDDDWMISVARLDGAYRNIIAQKGLPGFNNTKPNSLAVDPIKGNVYWSDLQGGIYSMKMDGSNVANIVREEKATNLTLDVRNGHLYWVADNKVRYIMLEASNEIKTVQSMSADIAAMTVHEGWIIYSDRATGKIHEMNIDEQTPTDLKDGIASVLAVYDKRIGNNSCEKQNGNCSQLCLPVGVDTRVCKCTMGYQLAADGRTCKTKMPFLLFSKGKELGGVLVNDSDHQPALATIAQISDATALDFYAKEEYIYWVDSRRRIIQRIKHDLTERQAIIENSILGVESIAIDWVAGNLYFSDLTQDVIEVSKLNGSYRHVIIHDDLDKPSNLVVDPIRGFLYWTDSGINPRIERARLDGSSRMTIFNMTGKNIMPSALTLDLKDNVLYWCDHRMHTIKKMTLNDGQHHNFTDEMGCDSIDIYEDKVYWVSSWNDNKGYIMVANKVTGFLYDKIEIDRESRLQSVRVYYNRTEYYHSDTVNNKCGRTDSGCEELCFYTDPGVTCRCAYGQVTNNGTCTAYSSFLAFSKVIGIESVQISDEANLNHPRKPIEDSTRMKNVIGIAMDYSNKRYFFSDIQMGSIQSVTFDSMDFKTIVENIGSVEGLAYEPVYHELYWTSFTDSSISRISLREYSAQKLPEKIVQLHANDHPRALVLDSCKSRIFWTNWNTDRASIQTAFLSGWNVTSIVTTNITTPNGLAIDHTAQKLYWIDARLDKIERMNYDGTNRVVIRNDRLQHGFGLTMYADFLYWTDWVQRAVLRCNKYTGEDFTMLRKNLPRQPMGIVAVAEDANSCLANKCSFNNGGCSDQCGNDESGNVICSCFKDREMLKDNLTCADLNKRACLPTEFECFNGTCLTFDKTCNNIPDCSDGVDEDSNFCESRVCPVEYFHCWTNKRCVSVNVTCDGHNDCGDRSDELICGCKADEYMCHEDGSCIVMKYRCDGDKDCPLGSDETACTEFPDCSHMTFGEHSSYEQWIKCNETSACILQSWICDGSNDCYDNSDEQNCGNDSVVVSCPENQVLCNNSAMCIPSSWLCDVDVDCPDKEDEKDCQHTCRADYEPCLSTENFQCIPSVWKCDGKYDCLDHSDEANCTKTSCEPDEFQCSTLRCIPNLWRCDGEDDCDDGADEHSNVGCSHDCSEEEFKCRNNMCVHKSFYCDGEDDCGDESDEPEWCVFQPCSSSEFACKHSTHTQCITKKRQCDGFFDCVDHSDEENCATEPPPCGDKKFMCNNRSCIIMSLVCDGKNDCGDWSDESLCGMNECEMPGICGSNATCHDEKVGYKCECKKGYRKVNEGARCLDIDECAEFYPCSHYCYNTVGGFKCRCADGYQLANKTMCFYKSDVPISLLVSNRYYIRNVTESGTVDLMVMDLQNAVALDFDWLEQKVYWSDVTSTGSSITRMSVNNSQDREVLHHTTLRNPDGIAVDWLGRNLYWCDKTTDTIEVSKLNGLYRKVLLRSGLQEPRGLAVHPFRGYLFYTDWGDHAHIGRLGMDGSDHKLLITSHLGWPNSLTIDYITDFIFWADARLDYIGMADWNGANMRYVIQKNLPHIFAITTFGDNVYWTDWENKSINRANKFSGLNVIKLAELIHRPMDIQVFHPGRQPNSVKDNYKNPCESNGDCLDGTLCLLKPGGMSRVCACPERHYLSKDKRSCISNCTSSEFLCQEMYKCIPFWWRCDGQADCEDNSDENNCTVTYHCHQPGLFQCKNAMGPFDCISPTQICDGYPQCKDGSDEINCEAHTCLDSQFKCHDPPKCIPLSKRCDKQQDCEDHTDEKICPPVQCGANEFQCTNKHCVPLMWRCDNDNDCGDNSDEPPDCKNTDCPDNYIQCNSTGRCVPETWVCDGDMDCASDDTSDEPFDKCNSTTCEATYFKCANNRCIPGRWKCDYDDDCGDKSDEVDCMSRNCSESEFECDDGRCIQQSFRCDGHSHCLNGSDEKNCKFSCEADEFFCSVAKYCIPQRWLCDGDLDCTNGEDEMHCSGMSCGRMEYRCDDGQCIPEAWLCDGQNDCFSGKDEDNGMCQNHTCLPGYFSCKDGIRCISNDLVCNGIEDCPDISDELNCGKLKCSEKQIKCGDNVHVCINLEQLCDNYLDCPNNYDEGEICQGEPLDCHTDQDCSGVPLTNCTDNKCLCAPGFFQHPRINNNSSRCQDINECEEFGRCDQFCINSVGGYKCHCAQGFFMSKVYTQGEMQLVCKANGPTEYLLIGLEDKILMTQKNKNKQQYFSTLYSADSDSDEEFRIEAMDVSIDLEVAFISNSHTGRLYKFPLHIEKDGSRYARDVEMSSMKLQDIIEIKIPGAEIQQPRGLAFDWMSSRLYWADSQKRTIECVTINNTVQGGVTGHKVLLDTNLEHVQALAVDPRKNHLYWTVLGPSARIEVSNLDGSDRRILVHEQVGWPSSLAVDVINSQVYWADIKKACIQSIHTTGPSKPITVWQFKHDEDVPYKVEVFEHSLYVTMYKSHDIVRLDKFGNERPAGDQLGAVYTKAVLDAGLIASHMDRVGDLRIVQQFKQGNYSANDHCALKPDICGENKICFNSNVNVTCVCMEGYVSAGGDCVPERLPENCNDDTYCQNGGRCNQFKSDPVKCSCKAGYDGVRCQHDRCYGHCVNGGTCVINNSSQTCACPVGYVGARCQYDQCINYCQNGGHCQKEANRLICQCTADFTGDHCERIKEKCDNYCYNNGTCSYDDQLRPQCQCADLFAGPQCKRCKLCNLNRPMEDCKELPYCNETADSYCFYDNDQVTQCYCPPGYKLNRSCDKPSCPPLCVSLCQDYCQNGGTCVLDEGVPKCTCPKEFTDRTCMTSACQKHCFYPGLDPVKRCQLDVDPVKCFCKDGFSGDHCNISTTCHNNMCSNNGTCINGSPMSCDCPPGYGGQFCTERTQCTDKNPCKNGGICEIVADKQTRCRCTPYFTGVNCGEPMPQKCRDACINSGWCDHCDRSRDQPRCIHCSCPLNYDGASCELSHASMQSFPTAAIIVPIILLLLCLIAIVIIVVYKKRYAIIAQFQHKRMTEGSEIHNPMYTGNDFEEETEDFYADRPTNFSNPMYEQFYNESVDGSLVSPESEKNKLLNGTKKQKGLLQIEEEDDDPQDSSYT